jgi:small subunit ribosomal protein S15
MSLSTQDKQEIIKKYQLHEKDTSSPQVLIALLTARLDYLNDHFKTNQKDFHSRLGLMKMVGHRRRLLTYLKRKDTNAYKELIGSLGIRK